MADLRNRLSENRPGKFYVDQQCIDCDVCRDTAPANFARNDENGYSYVEKQPENQQEYELCREAFDSCPVEAIGDDGVAAAVQSSSFSLLPLVVRQAKA
jgi:ferredoxin